MKHSMKITLLLITMFFVAQIISLGVMNSYTSYSKGTLPAWIEPPQDIQPQTSLISIIFAIAFGVVLMLLLMTLKAERFLRFWFFVVVIIAMSVTFNAAISGIMNLFGLSLLNSSFLIAVILSLPLAFIKIFIRNIKVHNITELAIYPGVAALIIPLLNVWTVAILLLLISLYDMYAVWHAGFMQKMARYQINQLKFFAGFFVPYVGKKEKELIKNYKISKSQKVKEKELKNIKVNVAILGGGDVVFPMILAGTVLAQFGILSALIVSICSTLALATLFYMSEKGKFYPAMPFISIGCYIALCLIYLIN